MSCEAFCGRRALLASAWFALALPACSHEGAIKIDTASQAAGQGPPFSLAPAQPEAQFQLAMRYDSGKGVEPDDAWAEYWAWRSARQGYEPARDWLRKRTYAEPIDQPALLWIELLNQMKNRSHPSAGIWLALAGPDPKVGSEDRR